MKTVRQYIKDELHYPVSDGFIENRLIARDLEPDALVTSEVAKLAVVRGAIADCLISLITMPDFSESDISISVKDRNLIIKRANALYGEIGEKPYNLDLPKVYIGC